MAVDLEGILERHIEFEVERVSCPDAPEQQMDDFQFNEFQDVQMSETASQMFENYGSVEIRKNGYTLECVEYGRIPGGSRVLVSVA